MFDGNDIFNDPLDHHIGTGWQYGLDHQKQITLEVINGNEWYEGEEKEDGWKYS